VPLQGSDRRSARGAVGAGQLADPVRRVRSAAFAIAAAVVVVAAIGSYSLRTARSEAARATTVRELGDQASSAIGRIHRQLAENRPIVFEGTARIVDGQVVLTPTGDLSDSSGLVSAVAAARDKGQPVLATVDGRAGANRAVVITPRYQGGQVAGTAARRSLFLDAFVRELNLISTASSAFEQGAVSTVLIDGAPLSGERFVGDVISIKTAHLGSTIEVQALVQVPPVSAAPWVALFIAGLGVAWLALQLGQTAARNLALAEQERASAVESAALVSRSGRLLQSSFDLSETVPGLVLQLMDALNLAGVAVLEANSSGAHRPLFAMGERIDPTDRRQSFYPLTRAGRDFGALSVIPQNEMQPATSEVLSAVAELLAAAIANASIVDSERALLEEMERLDSLKTDFLATVSHEVRTPLAAIIGFASLLRGSWESFTPEQIRDFVSRIDLNAVSLSAMLSEILDFSRLERGAVDVNLSSVDVVASIKEVLRRNAPLLADHVIELESPIRLEAWADRGAVEQAVSNLLTNAVKFSSSGGRILIRVKAKVTSVQIIVEDEGPGVALEEREKIFERFFRGASEAAGRTRGAGIGLAVVKELMARIGGSIRVEDASLGGAAFIIDLQPNQSRNIETTHHVTSDRDMVSGG
jgi:signal transduction histidine kinase